MVYDKIEKRKLLIGMGISMSKKDVIVFLIVTVLVGGLIYFLPQIDSLITGKKVHGKEEEVVSTKKEVDKYTCTFGSNSNLIRQNIEATFYLSNEQVTRIYTRQTQTYPQIEDYKNALKETEKENDDEDYTVKVALDDINNTIITTKGINIKEGIKVDYPTNYEELTNYLEKNNYTCSVHYKQ